MVLVRTLEHTIIIVYGTHKHTHKEEEEEEEEEEEFVLRVSLVFLTFFAGGCILLLVQMVTHRTLS